MALILFQFIIRSLNKIHYERDKTINFTNKYSLAISAPLKKSWMSSVYQKQTTTECMMSLINIIYYNGSKTPLTRLFITIHLREKVILSIRIQIKGYILKRKHMKLFVLFSIKVYSYKIFCTQKII